MKKVLLGFVILSFVIPLIYAADNDLSLSKSTIQLGDDFSINAENIKVSDQIFTGNAMIHFDGPGDEHTLLVHVFEGDFSYSASFCRSGCVLPNVLGNYTVSVALLDSKLNELEEILIPENLEVDSQLNVIAELDNIQITPGESVKIEGSVQRNSDSQMVDNGDVKIIFDEVLYETVISSEKFVYEFNTGFDIASNYHDVEISITDDQGNYGETAVQFFVVAVPQALSINLDKDSYLPGDNVEITIGLNDQAGDEVFEDVEIKLYNSKNKRVLKDIVLSNEEFDFQLEDFAYPGDWRITAKSSGLKIDRTFEVATVEKLDIHLVGQDLEVSNIGNIPYSKPLIIVVDDDARIEKRTNLAPGDNVSLTLYVEVDEGIHKLYIENTDQTFELDIIDNRGFGERIGDFFSSVTGQAVRSSGSGTSDTPFLILVGLIVGLLVFVSVKLRGKRFFKFGLKKPKFKSRKSEDIEDIRTRILKDIESSKIEKEEDKKSFSVQPIFKSDDTKPSRVKFDEPMRKEEPKKEETNTGNLFKIFD